jgi:hypothetical protein
MTYGPTRGRGRSRRTLDAPDAQQVAFHAHPLVSAEWGRSTDRRIELPRLDQPGALSGTQGADPVFPRQSRTPGLMNDLVSIGERPRAGCPPECTGEIGLRRKAAGNCNFRNGQLTRREQRLRAFEPHPAEIAMRGHPHCTNEHAGEMKRDRLRTAESGLPEGTDAAPRASGISGYPLPERLSGRAGRSRAQPGSSAGARRHVPDDAVRMASDCNADLQVRRLERGEFPRRAATRFDCKPAPRQVAGRRQDVTKTILPSPLLRQVHGTFPVLLAGSL